MNNKWSKVLALTLSSLMLLPLAAHAEDASTPPSTEQPAPTDPGTGTTDPGTGTTDPDCTTPPPAAPAADNSTQSVQTTEASQAVPEKGHGNEKGNTGKGSSAEKGAPSSSKESVKTTTEEEPADACEAPDDSQQSAAAHAKVAAHLQAMLDAGKIANPNAHANVQAVIAKMLGDMKTGGDAATDGEALTTIEATVEAEGQAATPAEMDVMAEAQVRLGKADKAKATLKARLKKEDSSKAAYIALIKLEQQSGEAVDLDTYVGGEKVQFDVRPKVKEGRTLVPIRALVEKLGAEVTWDEATQTVTIVKGETEIKLTIGSDIALVNGEEVKLDAAAEVDGGRTLIPARFVSEGLGLYVHWLAEQRTILVTEQPVADEPAPAPAPAPEPTPAPAQP